MEGASVRLCRAGDPFSAQGIRIFNIIRGPYEMISLEVSLLCWVKLIGEKLAGTDFVGLLRRGLGVPHPWPPHRREPGRPVREAVRGSHWRTERTGAAYVTVFKDRSSFREPEGQ